MDGNWVVFFLLMALAIRIILDVVSISVEASGIINAAYGALLSLVGLLLVLWGEKPLFGYLSLLIGAAYFVIFAWRYLPNKQKKE